MALVFAFKNSGAFCHYPIPRSPITNLFSAPPWCSFDFALLSCEPFDIVRRVKKLPIILTILAIVTAMAPAAYAATDISGTWNAKVDLGGQGGSPTFVLKQDGEKLTGKYSGALGDSDVTGTVKGSAITIDFDVQGNKIHYEGKLNVDGTQIEGTCDYGGQASGTFTAKKAEKKADK
jgi:hypothetical protein